MVPRTLLGFEPPAWVADYVGLPFAIGGRTRAGVDCWGLVDMVYREQFGVPLPSDGPRWDKGMKSAQIAVLAEEEFRLYRKVEEHEARLGDGIVLRIEHHPIHVGVVVARGLFLHVEEKAASVLARWTSPTWKRRVIAFYAYEGPR